MDNLEEVLDAAWSEIEYERARNVDLRHKTAQNYKAENFGTGQ